MRIYTKQIKPEGINLRQDLDSQEIGLSDEEAKCQSPLNVNAHVDLAEDTVLVNMEAKAEFSFVCSRCLEPFDRLMTRKFILDYEIDKKTEFIDLDEDIRQEMVLAFPQSILCREDCKGLCPDCGVNLNNEACKCKALNTKPQTLKTK